jgi:hypothetical protein
LLKNTTAKSCAGTGVGEGVAVGTRVAVAVGVAVAVLATCGGVVAVAVGVAVLATCGGVVAVAVGVGDGGADSTPAAPMARLITTPSSSARHVRTRKPRGRMPALAYTRALT